MSAKVFFSIKLRFVKRAKNEKKNRFQISRNGHSETNTRSRWTQQLECPRMTKLASANEKDTTTKAEHKVFFCFEVVEKNLYFQALDDLIFSKLFTTQSVCFYVVVFYLHNFTSYTSFVRFFFFFSHSIKLARTMLETLWMLKQEVLRL